MNDEGAGSGAFGGERPINHRRRTCGGARGNFCSERPGERRGALGGARGRRRSSRSPKTPRHVARGVHRRRRLRAGARTHGLAAPCRHALRHGGGSRGLRRAQHVVGRRYRRQNGANGDASHSARRRSAARGAGDRPSACGRLGRGARPSGQLVVRGALGVDDRDLHPALHDGSEALDAAKHRDRRRSRRASASHRLGCGDGRAVGRAARALPVHFPVDAAAFLGAGALPQR